MSLASLQEGIRELVLLEKAEPLDATPGDVGPVSLEGMFYTWLLDRPITAGP